MQENDLIAAIATPIGKGAIGCIRLSGTGCDALVRKLVKGLPNEREHAKMHTGTFCGRVKDKIMAVVFYDGKSYTGEESAELYFHGGRFLLEQALCSVLDAGARMAEAGEFTRRAFLNGKLDLTQAEGVGDLIDGESLQALEDAYEQSEGKTRKEIEEIYAQAVTAAAHAEVCIDYPEEDIEEQTREELLESIRTLREKIERQMKGYDGGRIRREGARVVLTGKTNAGKSTLFNTLLGEDRAIVSDEEGTTRDTIEEKIRYKDAAFVLVDTAGLRETENKVEKMGIERSQTAVKTADLVVYVVRKGEKIAESLDETAVLVVNSWQPDAGGETVLRVAGKDKKAIELNARTGAGADALLQTLYRLSREKTQTSGVVNNARVYEALRTAHECLLRAQEAVQTLTADCVCADLTAAVSALGRITGKTASDSVVDEIFSKFCVGK